MERTCAACTLACGSFSGSRQKRHKERQVRPRTHETGLPKCVYFRHGAYYLVKRKKWHYLGRHEDDAIKKAEALGEILESPENIGNVRGHLRKIANGLRAKYKNGSIRGGRTVSIDADHVESLAAANDWCCAVSGIPFRLQKLNGRRPYAPSVDRIDCTKGYEPGNCRVVCVAVNYAMNVWGEGMLNELADAIYRSRGA